MPEDTGTGHSSHLGVPADALSISGALRQYDTTAESGNVPTGDYVRSAARRSLFETSGVAGLTFLTAGSIDDPTLFEPGMVVFTASARLWDHIDPALQRFPRMPQA